MIIQSLGSGCEKSQLPSEMLYFALVISLPTALLSLLQQIAVPLSNVQEKRNAQTLELVLQLLFTDEYVNLPPQQKAVPS